MAKPIDEDLSAAATSTVARSNLDVTSDAPGASTALNWAASRFEFDLENPESQSGIQTLQSWLKGQGYDTSLDGILGPQTIAVLEREFETSRPDLILKAETGKYKYSFDADGRAQQEADSKQNTGDSNTEEVEVAARPVALSDSAIDDVSQDRLGFAPYVDAVAEFILAEQTRPPLSLVINAQWGQGKTSFMNMLDGQLKEKCRGSTLRVATTWFNPWKYSEPEQVWAAFVANVTRCVRANLTPGQMWSFKRARFAAKLRRHADFPLVLRLAVAFIFVLLVITLPFTLDLPAFHAAFEDKGGILGAFYAATEAIDGWLWWTLFIPFALLSVLYGYITFTKGLGLNLLEYVEKTDFRDKIGTLSQFESEMRRLADAVPDDLKIVVFIDDLDRCKGKVLGEIVEALQLADVSRSCIFVMGMDLKIVANAIEKERSELAASAGKTAEMEHGSGYKFLEKIIQARLALPNHGQAEMARLVTSAMDGQKQEAGSGTGLGSGPERPEGVIEATINTLTGRKRDRREAPSDSNAVIVAAEHYGSRHFTNPRRLKRFINGFRLQAYLANAVRPGRMEIDRLARFMVLAEKWPAVASYMLENELGSLDLIAEEPGHSTNSMSGDITTLPRETRELLYELLDGQDRQDLPTYEEWKDLATWTGFSYYPGLDK